MRLFFDCSYFIEIKTKYRNNLNIIMATENLGFSLLYQEILSRKSLTDFPYTKNPSCKTNTTLHFKLSPQGITTIISIQCYYK